MAFAADANILDEENALVDPEYIAVGLTSEVHLQLPSLYDGYGNQTHEPIDHYEMMQAPHYAYNSNFKFEVVVNAPEEDLPHILESNMGSDLPFAHLAEAAGYLPTAASDCFYRRNSTVSNDFFAIHLGNVNQLRSRAGSNFDINDCFSKDNNIEENVCLGTVSIKTSSLFKRSNQL